MDMTAFNVDDLPDDEWETLASAGRAVMQDLDSGRWLAGDIANRCATRYGETSLTKFAADVGIARAGTLREYARVAKFYPRATRVAFGDEAGLSWSHFREALRAKDDAELFLVQAQDNGWPVAVMAREIAAAIGKPVPPRKLFDAEAVVLFAADCTLTLGLDADTPLGEGQKVRVVVYEWNTDLVTGTGRKVEVGA